jgi:hypothetical protein
MEFLWIPMGFLWNPSGFLWDSYGILVIISVQFNFEFVCLVVIYYIIINNAIANSS